MPFCPIWVKTTISRLRLFWRNAATSGRRLIWPFLLMVECRCFRDAASHIDAEQYHKDAGQERDPPGPCQQLVVPEIGDQRECAERKQVSDADADRRPAGKQASPVGRRIFAAMMMAPPYSAPVPNPCARRRTTNAMPAPIRRSGRKSVAGRSASFRRRQGQASRPGPVCGPAGRQGDQRRFRQRAGR